MMVKEMLSVLMDGIKDTGMWLDYVDEAEGEELSWFMAHAKSRTAELKEDYDYVTKHIGLIDKAREGDAIAEALLCHLKEQINDVINKVNKI